MRWPAAEPLETDRLILEPLRREHAAEMAGVLAAPEIYEHIGGSPPSRIELEQRYARQEAGASPGGEQGWLNWIVRRGDDGAAAGYVQATLSRQDDGETLAADLAWVIAPPAQGAGLATESAAAVLGWLADAGVGTFAALIHPANRASQVVALRLGLEPTAEIVEGEVRWIRGAG